MVMRPMRKDELSGPHVAGIMREKGKCHGARLVRSSSQPGCSQPGCFATLRADGDRGAIRGEGRGRDEGRRRQISTARGASNKRLLGLGGELWFVPLPVYWYYRVDLLVWVLLSTILLGSHGRGRANRYSPHNHCAGSRLDQYQARDISISAMQIELSDKRKHPIRQI
jgi:hypothetical protein